jgi:hypothetical protein
VAFPPLPNWTLWEGWVDRSRITRDTGDLVFRLELYVSERDSFGVRFSDDVILHRQLFVRVAPPEGGTVQDGVGGISWSENPRLSADGTLGKPATPMGDAGLAWQFAVDYADFEATLAIELKVQGRKARDARPAAAGRRGSRPAGRLAATEVGSAGSRADSSE